ncbi:hypothetical protein U1Q18_050979 [Sarracenia purpurea var. burkii]
MEDYRICCIDDDNESRDPKELEEIIKSSPKKEPEKKDDPRNDNSQTPPLHKPADDKAPKDEKEPKKDVKTTEPLRTQGTDKTAPPDPKENKPHTIDSELQDLAQEREIRALKNKQRGKSTRIRRVALDPARPPFIAGLGGVCVAKKYITLWTRTHAYGVFITDVVVVGVFVLCLCGANGREENEPGVISLARHGWRQDRARHRQAEGIGGRGGGREKCREKLINRMPKRGEEGMRSKRLPSVVYASNK